LGYAASESHAEEYLGSFYCAGSSTGNYSHIKRVFYTDAVNQMQTYTFTVMTGFAKGIVRMRSKADFAFISCPLRYERSCEKKNNPFRIS
jgi:hypothetical protein